MSRKHFVGRRVEVEGGESIDSALRRLEISLQYEYRRWTKKRCGYHEKPSALRRKKKKMARLCQIRCGPCQGGTHQARWHLFMRLRTLVARTGSVNSIEL